MAVEATIERLGAQGDGIARMQNGTQLFVPFTLPGERVALEPGDNARALPAAILQPSPHRIASVCRHFGVCGNCVAQHMDAETYLAWKQEIMRSAFQVQHLDLEIEPIRQTKISGRRRTVFGLARKSGRTVFGYRRRKSHELFDVKECPVLEPKLAAALSELARLLAPLAPARGVARVSVTLTDAGFDIAVSDAKLPEGRRLESLARDAVASGVARFIADGDLIAQTATPTVRIATVPVPVPPAGFLQASAEAEAILSELVCEGVGDAASVADLFAGVGTFTLALAQQAKVLAGESDPAALEALDKALRGSRGLKPVTLRRADLFRAPLSAKELNGFDAVVFDPPRAGAKEQVAQLATSKVPRVVAVSCNPATLARDLRTLVDGGYRIERVTPVDQFVFSSELEAVALVVR